MERVELLFLHQVASMGMKRVAVFHDGGGHAGSRNRLSLPVPSSVAKSTPPWRERSPSLARRSVCGTKPTNGDNESIAGSKMSPLL